MITEVSFLLVIVTSIIAIMVIVLVLVSALLYARAKLTAVGQVKITINGEKEVHVNPGGTLLSTLSESGNFLPSACGGGAGLAPMRSHLFHLFYTLKEEKKKVTFWYGARSWKEVFYYDEFREIEKNFPNFTFTLALSEPRPEDNWTGPKGFIHQVIFDKYLGTHEEPEEINYYLCGPPLMNDAVQKMLYDLGVPPENILFDNFGG